MDQTEHELYAECYKEVQKQFPGTRPDVLQEMAGRLFKEANPDIPRPAMGILERSLRRAEFGTALQTIPPIRGVRPEDRRLDNAEN